MSVDQATARDVSTDSLKRFLDDIGKVDLLTAAQEVELVRRSAQTHVSLAKPLGDEDGSEFGDLLADENAASPDELADTTLREEALRKILHTLPDRQRRVLELRFGIGGVDPQTLGQ